MRVRGKGAYPRPGPVSGPPDQFVCGRRFRGPNVVDDVTRECLAATPAGFALHLKTTIAKRHKSATGSRRGWMKVQWQVVLTEGQLIGRMWDLYREQR